MYSPTLTLKTSQNHPHVGPKVPWHPVGSQRLRFRMPSIEASHPELAQMGAQSMVILREPPDLAEAFCGRLVQTVSHKSHRKITTPNTNASHIEKLRFRWGGVSGHLHLTSSRPPHARFIVPEPHSPPTLKDLLRGETTPLRLVRSVVSVSTAPCASTAHRSGHGFFDEIQ